MWALSCNVSDHFSIVLKYSSQLKGPKPFRFNNLWLRDANFKSVVFEPCMIEVREGWMICKLKDKLRALKETLKIHNKEVLGNVVFKVKVCRNNLQEHKQKAKTMFISHEELFSRLRLFQ